MHPPTLQIKLVLDSDACGYFSEKHAIPENYPSLLFFPSKLAGGQETLQLWRWTCHSQKNYYHERNVSQSHEISKFIRRKTLINSSASMKKPRLQNKPTFSMKKLMPHFTPDLFIGRDQPQNRILYYDVDEEKVS